MKILIKNNKFILSVISKLNISYYISFIQNEIIIDEKDFQKVNKSLEKDYKKVLNLVLSKSELTLRDLKKISDLVPYFDYIAKDNEFSKVTMTRYDNFYLFIKSKIITNKTMKIKKWLKIESFLKTFYDNIIELNNPLLAKKVLDRLSGKTIKIPKDLKKILKVKRK